MYHTNFSNIYSRKNCEAGWRTFVLLPLKASLCKEHVFEEKKRRTCKRKTRKRPRAQSEQAKKKEATEKLFWLLISDQRVNRCINKQLNIIFSIKNKKKPKAKELAVAATTSTSSRFSGKGRSRMSNAPLSQSLSITNSEKDIMLLDSDDSDVKSIMDNQLQEEEEEESRDLTAKDINALIFMSLILCQSLSIKGEITIEYLKKLLYTNKRDFIPVSAFKSRCKVINTVKSVAPKENGSSYKWLGLFELHNTLLSFVFGLTKKKTNGLFPIVKDSPNQENMAITLDSKTIYSLFSKDYHIYKPDKSELTTSGIINSTKDKEDVLPNFFDISKTKLLSINATKASIQES